ncbi:MAG: Stp1/IreP family PP2C-type Ser/Thr phosphatase [Clostridiales bacterium]|nr:Stp1/IreP family PP2C-type Ser/Thr phosphatase [Clostridiales bacterium]
MKFNSRTDKGNVRATNQDAFFAGELSDGSVLAVVCDGMGGASGGDIASQMAVEHITDSIISVYRPDMSDIAVKSILISSLEEANKIIYEKSLSSPDYFGMGTTAVCAIVKTNKIYIVHAGDSRAYCIDDVGIVQLTKDHSVVQRMVEEGTITREKAVTHPDRNLITRAIGVDRSVNVDFCQETVFQNDLILLCTDGLSGCVSNEEILSLCRENGVDTIADKLVDEAKANGGRDNITAVVIECGEVVYG